MVSEPSVSVKQTLTLGAVLAHIGAAPCGDPDTRITGINALELAEPGHVTFADSDRYAALVRHSRAAAIIVGPQFPAVEGRTLIRMQDPRLAFVRVMYLFQSLQPAVKPSMTIHRDALVAADAELGEGVTIREGAVIRSGAKIGAGTIIESGVHVGDGVILGEQCVIGPNVVIMHGSRIGNRVIMHGGTVIGADGFGYVWADGQYLKIPQLGNVIIEDDVELGANVCVDRATMGSTIIGRGTKVDNLVQIAHNDLIGEHVIMSGQVGLAGSVTVGNRAVFGGQAGVADHLTIGDDAKIGAGSGVIKDVRPGETVWWFPARPIKEIKRELAALALLPQLLKRLSKRAAAPKEGK